MFMEHMQRGQRVRLVRCSDPYTELRPGALGTVDGRYDKLGGLPVRWDSGSTLSMLPAEGDVVEAVR